MNDQRIRRMISSLTQARVYEASQQVRNDYQNKIDALRWVLEELEDEELLDRGM